ncbi:MAG: FG-GAP repeat protein, partial [Magnetococcales bacterium]|nr:FG-GAP repeat protein [Magnetococcales bacterium]
DGLGAISYQWQADGVNIVGATGSTLVLAEAQVGSVITVLASYSDGHGTAESVTSASTSAVANVNDLPTGTVTISGTPHQNQTLTASNNLTDADGLGTMSYQWQASLDGSTGWVGIAGANTNTFVPAQSEVGYYLRVVASYTDGFGTVESVSSTATTLVLDTTPPTTMVASILLSNDSAANGATNSDFITKGTAQTVSGTLSAVLAADETVYVSLDNGATWTAALATVGQNTWSLAGQTLTASNTLLVKVSDAAGNDGTIASQTYVLDTIAPTTTIATLTFSADTAANGGIDSDFNTKTAAQTISGTLSANLATDETVYVSLNNGATWTAATATAGQNTWSMFDTLAANNTLKVKVTDAAGNDGVLATQAYILDNTAPTATISGLHLQSDTGSSATDFVTNTAAQTITATLSAGLAVGEIVYASLDGGSSWSEITGMVSGTTINWTGVTLAGSSSIQLKVTDTAGNDGAMLSQAFVVDSAAPTATISAMDIVQDAGVSATDFVTNVATQTITATLSTGLAAGELLYGSVNGGSSWSEITGMVSGTAINWTGATLAGSSSMQFKVVDLAGNEGATATQSYLLDSSVQVPGTGSMLFAKTNDATTDANPNAVSSVDVNGDGKPDMLVANFTTGSVSVFLNNGNGTFASKTDYPTGQWPSYVGSSDVNSDGNADLLVVNSYSNTFSVLLNNGDGTLASKVDYGTNVSPRALSVANVNGDGKPDLVVVNYSANNVSVFLNNGNGTFASKVDYAVGSGPFSVSSADVNGDGKDDILVPNADSNTVSLLLNNGDGTFASKTDYAAGLYPYSINSVDVNGDGKPDMLVSNLNANTVSVFLNNGDGTFASKTDYPTGAHPYSVSHADVNGDSRPDILMANFYDFTVSVFLNNGDGTFASKTDFATGIYPRDVSSDDLNGDGKPDLLVSNGDATVSVFLNQSSHLSLATADDSGYSQADHITAQTAGLHIHGGGGEVGATVTLFDDANNNGVFDSGETTLGNTAVGSDGFWSVVISLAGDGVHPIRAVQTDVAGNSSAASAVLLVTQDATAPTLLSSSPADNATDIATSSNIVLTFSENVLAGSGNIVISNGSDIRTIAMSDSTQVSFSGSTLTINPTTDLLTGTTYSVQMASGVIQDLAGNPYAGISDSTTLDFTLALASAIDLSNLDGTTGFRLDGQAAGDFAGRSVSSAGDVNGDGFADVIIGARDADPNGLAGAGSSYVLFGRSSGFTSPLDLSSLNGATGFRLDGNAAGDSFGIAVSLAGDVNGDGFSDLIVGAHTADPNGSSSGAAYVIFGRATGFSSVLSVATLDGSNGFRLNGGAAGDLLGWTVNAAGDVNGDGLDDLLLGARYADPNGVTDAGTGYVVFGRANNFQSVINLTSLDGSTGFRLDGIAADDTAGFPVSSAGDVNGDGFDDLLIGALQTDPNGFANAGSAYIVFGKSSGFSSSFSLSSLNGGNGFRMDGVAAGDMLARSVSAAGDVNGDGVADLIIGAFTADPGGLSSAGSVYVVFGQTAAFASVIHLADLVGNTGFRLDGVAATDQAGIAVSSAGDFNGDGYDDLFVGAHKADANGLTDAGAAYIIYGKSSGFAATIPLSSLDGSNGFRMAGVAANDWTGYSVQTAGDLNGDGFDDLIIGAMQADPNGISDAGSSYVIFGSHSTNAVTFLGSADGDTLVGTAADESFVGGNGSDTLIGSGGVDLFYAGAGNDIIGVSDLTFRLADGGGGIDTFSLQGSGFNVNLSALAVKLQGIEIIDMTGTGANTLHVTSADLLPLSGSSNSLTIMGDSGDQVTLDGIWSDLGVSGGYHGYRYGQATLQVATAVTVSSINVAPSGSDSSFTVAMNGSRSFTAGDFGFRNVKDGGPLSSHSWSVVDPDGGAGTYGTAWDAGIGDLNGDGRLDLLAGANTSGGIGIYTLSGSRSFTPTLITPVTVSYEFYGADVVDLNFDGLADFITAGPNGASTSPNHVYYASNGSLAYLNNLYGLSGNTMCWFSENRTNRI